MIKFVWSYIFFDLSYPYFKRFYVFDFVLNSLKLLFVLFFLSFVAVYILNEIASIL